MVRIPITLQPLLDVIGREPPSLLKQLHIGQVLQAKVLEQPQPGLLRLQIARTEVLARSQVALEPGTSLRLEVVKGPPLPELRVIRAPTRQEVQQEVARSALIRELPRQEVRQATAELRIQAQTPKQADAVGRLVSILQDAGVKLDQLKPAQLQRAVALSGLFHEARLLSAGGPHPADVKTRLLQLVTLLRSEFASSPRPDISLERRQGPPAPALGEQAVQPRETLGDSLLGRLIRLAEASIARIQLQQSASLPVDDTQRQAWQVDLPIHLPDGTDDLEMRIERDAAHDVTDGTPGWAVNLVFQFDTLGTLQCRVALSGDRVATTFWCERAATQQRLEQRLPVLREALTAQGLEVVHLAGVLGEPAEPLIRIPVPETLLDEHA